MRGNIPRPQYALSKMKALEIIRSSDYGVLATVNIAGEPSTVALNHVLINNETLVFHCGPKGETIKNIKQNPNVSFFIVGSTKIVPKNFTNVYTSAVAHGTANIIENDDDEKQKYLRIIADRFIGNTASTDAKNEHIEKALDRISIIKMSIKYLTGKAYP